VVSDTLAKNGFTLSTRFVLDSPVSRRQHAVVQQKNATIP
jgi:hypothetical protein